MNRDGYEKLMDALGPLGIIQGSVKPKPEGDQDVQFVSIHLPVGYDLSPAEVLNAMGTAGLLEKTGEPETGIPTGPEFRVTPVSLKSCLTLEDINHQ